MSFAAFERQRLAHLLEEVGPAAPTLCEGWTTRELAAHLFVREHVVKAGLGLVIPALGAFHDKAVEDYARRGYLENVHGWAAGPPKLVRPVDSLINLAENFVHHEDVRRADGIARPRDLSAATQQALWKATQRMAPLLLGSSRVPVVLVAEGHYPVTIGGKRGVAQSGAGVVRVMGQAGEILLWVFGRNPVDVTIEGNA